MVVTACLGVLLLVGSALGVVAAMVADHRAAQAAADLAALAGAVAARDGGDPCAAAGGVAARNGARLVSCVVLGPEVTVEVEVPGPRWLGQTHDLRAAARAGPVGVARAGLVGRSVGKLCSRPLSVTRTSSGQVDDLAAHEGVVRAVRAGR